jgi:diacylglycerol kinase
MTNFFRSFIFAIDGIKLLFKGYNFKIQILLFILISVFGLFVSFTAQEWMLVLLTSGCVLAAEGFNTAIEELCNLYSTDTNSNIRRIKDISAGAVLILSVFSFFIGLLLIWKYFFNVFCFE